ncbi:SusC/RagA family TonB-linked outer membrane protein [Desertivirga xinjiangensis]|uniref:SusC/RagA family TonB-linked outer membrane protein n=1 Tax=Desertivirga xinjiangensis TaxID=539206 RepID=UPI002108F91D|nr:TonB-dependent receptor [Pedobacter xinjiangensis]
MSKIIPKIRFLVFFIATVLSSNAVAQTTVKGIVREETGAIIPGATIRIKGTATSSVSDAAGRFSIAAKAGDLLLISGIGYESTEVAAENKDLLVVLKSSVRELSQVVVVGYGTQKKKDLTGAVSTISSKDVGGRQTVQVSEALQGAVSGVSVTRSNGKPGEGASILIRGISTIGENSPLIIVDGVQTSTIDNVNPNDVENVTVLKDAASASIYGSRAAAGVILITTKRGKSGQKSFEYNYEYGLQKPTALPEYVGSADYMRYFNEQATNDGAAAGPYAQDFIDNFEKHRNETPDLFPFGNTDWQEILLNDLAPRQRHDMVFTLGTDKVKTKASLGYSDIDALHDNSSYKRFLFRINNDLELSKKMSVSLDLGFKRTGTVSPQWNVFYESRLMPPVYNALYQNGNYALAKEGRNPFAQLKEGGTVNGKYNQLTGRMAFKLTPVTGLQLTALLSPTLSFDQSKSFSKRIRFTNPDGTETNLSNQIRTSLLEDRTESSFITGQLLADYTKTIGAVHQVGLLGGYEEIYNRGENMGASRSGFALNDFPYLNAGSQELRDNYGSASESALRSVFGRVMYNYKSKYYFQGNLRYDESSRFSKENRGAFFPSLSLGWSISEEVFMRSIEWLSFLKIRGSYGSVGNERIGDYPYQATISFSNPLFYLNGVVVPQTGGAQTEYAVEDISWETTRTVDAGLDVAFFKNRLNFTADYYHKKTSDILLRLDIPMYLGYDKPNQNAGVLEVKGWETEFSWKDRLGKLTYSAAVNLSDAKSSITDLRATVLNPGGPQSSFKGSEYNEWFGYRSNGLFQSAEEAKSSPRLNENVTAGDIRYEDMNGDGKITPDDKVLLGGSLPRYLYGGNLRLEYKGVDFGVVVQGVGKSKSRLSSDIIRPFQEGFGNVPEEMVGKFWSKGNTPDQNLQATYPRLSTRSASSNYELSDFWLINGAYFRVKNLTLGYTLSNTVVKKVGLQSMRLYVSANDVFAAHNFPKYWDPELSSSSYPMATTLMAGASVRF